MGYTTDNRHKVIVNSGSETSSTASIPPRIWWFFSIFHGEVKLVARVYRVPGLKTILEADPCRELTRVIRVWSKPVIGPFDRAVIHEVISLCVPSGVSTIKTSIVKVVAI